MLKPGSTCVWVCSMVGLSGLTLFLSMFANPTHGLILLPKPLSLSVLSIFHVSLSRNSTQHLLRLSMWMSFLSLFWNQQNMEQEQSNTFIYLVFVFFKGRATQEQLLIFAPHIFISNTFNFIDKNQFEIVYLIWFKIGCRCLSWVLFINLTNLFSIELYIYLEVTK